MNPVNSLHEVKDNSSLRSTRKVRKNKPEKHSAAAWKPNLSIRIPPMEGPRNIPK